MSAATLWPHVSKLVEGKGIRIPRLDYSPPYPVEELRARAQTVTDPLLSQLLSDLIDNPAMLSALNRQPAVRNLNVSLHYIVASKLEPAKRARARVADAWGIKESMVKDVLGSHGDMALEWLANLIGHIEARVDFASDEDIHRALDADLIDRAATMKRDFRRHK